MTTRRQSCIRKTAGTAFAVPARPPSLRRLSCHETGWDFASAPRAKRDSARRARTWSGKDRRSLGTPQGGHFGAPSPGAPVREEGAAPGCQGPCAGRLGNRAGIPLAACRTSSGSLHFACSREANHHETRGCKLNGKFASCSSRPFVTPFPSLPQPPTSGGPRTVNRGEEWE